MSFITEYFGLVEGTGEQAVCCPFPHKTDSGLEYYENRPSASVNTTKMVFHCMACDRGYGEAQFIGKILGCNNHENIAKIQHCFNTREDRAEWKQSTTLSDASRALAHAFNISDDALEELDVATPMGTDLLAYPVFMYDHLVDVRIYNPGNRPKVKSRTGAPHGLIIPFDLWKDTPLTRWTLICAGEKDMAVARSHGFNAITITGGEQALPVAKNYFKDRKVAIVYDNDGAGKSGAMKLARYLCDVADTVKVVTNFHQVCTEKGEDITDYFNKYEKTKADLIKCLEETEPYNPENDPESVANYPLMNLLEASKAENRGRLVRTNVQVVSVSEDTYSCPRTAVATKVGAANGDTMMVGEVRQWDLTNQTLPDVLHLIDNNFKEEQIKDHMKTLMHIMRNEKYVSMKYLETVSVFKCCVTDLFETTDDVSAPMEYTVYSIGKKLESGQKYMITHMLTPHPYKGQMLISIAVDFKQANDSVSDFTLTDENIAHLKVIQDMQGTVKERIHQQVQKFKGILGYDGNDTLITALDLAYNTVLQFNFGQFKKVRGYLDTFVISESRVGKSSTVDALRRTYGLGAITSLAGNSATIPGLVGGSNKTATGNQTRAGVIPQNHKGLITFEEFGKSSRDVATELTDIRSSNEVRIARVSGTLTLPALVRMITLTNPKTVNGQIKSIASYPNGISILAELVTTAEDIARYDMIVILSDRGAASINPLWTPEEPFEREVYRTRIRWIWSRTPEQIIIPTDVLQYIVECSNGLNAIYGGHIKIFGTEAWKKLSRLAIAVAGYLVSTDETYMNIVVKKEHVDFAMDFLVQLYDNPTFKLREYVEHERKFSTIDNEGINLLQAIYDKYPMLILQLEQCSSTTRNVLQAATGVDHDMLNKALNELTKGLFVTFNNYDIIPTERFRLGIASINKKTHLTRLGEINA